VVSERSERLAVQRVSRDVAVLVDTRHLRGDAKVANRGIRVWHGATEKGP
jgi:hypothetical protein